MRSGYWWICLTRNKVYWSQWIRGDSLPVNSGSCEDLMDVPAPQGANIMVCLQGENIRTFQVDLPRKNRQRFLQSIPYVLEDKLLHGPEDYHFVPITKEHDSGRIAVAVIAKEEFDKTISKISDKHWHVNLITADYIFIAEPEQCQWILDITDSPALLRGNYPELGSALAGDITARLHPALRLALERSVTPPEKLQIRVSNEEQSEKINSWREDLNELGVQSEIIVDDKSRIDWLSRFPDPGMGVNFLTGNYKTASRKTNLFSQYAPAMVMTLLLLILILAQVVLDKDRVETEYEFLRAEMEDTYRELFPQARNLVDPRFQMEQAMERLQSSSVQNQNSATGFLSQLETFSRLINPDTGNIEQIEYDGEKLSVDFSIENYELLEELQQRLGSEMDVTVEKAELQGEQVKSRISLETRT